MRLNNKIVHTSPGLLLINATKQWREFWFLNPNYYIGCGEKTTLNKLIVVKFIVIEGHSLGSTYKTYCKIDFHRTGDGKLLVNVTTNEDMCLSNLKLWYEKLYKYDMRNKI